MKFEELNISKKNTLLVYFHLRGPYDWIGQVDAENPIKTYSSLKALYKDISVGVFDQLEEQDASDSIVKKQSPFVYDNYSIFVDGDKSVKYKGKHDFMLRIPRLKKKCN